MASLFREIRERWIDQLHAQPEVQALGLTFSDLPVLMAEDVAKGARRGYVAIGDERATDETGAVLTVTLTTTVVGGELEPKALADLIDESREAVIAAFLADTLLGNTVGNARYVGSMRANDDQGRRLYGARHYLIAFDYPNPVQPTLC